MAHGPLILRLVDQLGVDRGNGIRSFPLVGGDTGADRLLTGMTVIPVGASIPLHTHSSEEFIIILEGRAVCEVADARHELGPLDSTYVPAALEHRFLNVGDTELRILWVYSDVHATRTLVETGETLGHLESYPDRS